MFGQFADVFGRHATLQTAMGLMLVGSALCAGAQTWGMLLLGRAIQGMASAGIMNIIKIVLADKVSLEENAKNNTVFALVGGISYSVGPVIGGYLTSVRFQSLLLESPSVADSGAGQLAVVLHSQRPNVRGGELTRLPPSPQGAG